jgi:hypothetical protein
MLVRVGDVGFSAERLRVATRHLAFHPLVSFESVDF